MGWISDKFQREGRAKWGKPISADKRRAPLRKIVAVVHGRTSLFDSDLVELECGHTARAFGDLKARCVKCLREREDLAVQPTATNA